MRRSVLFAIVVLAFGCFVSAAPAPDDPGPWFIDLAAHVNVKLTDKREYKAKGIVFLGASLDDAKSKAKVPEFVEKYKIAFPVLLGASGDDLDKWKMGEAVPATMESSQGNSTPNDATCLRKSATVLSDGMRVSLKSSAIGQL